MAADAETNTALATGPARGTVEWLRSHQGWLTALELAPLLGRRARIVQRWAAEYGCPHEHREPDSGGKPVRCFQPAAVAAWLVGQGWELIQAAAGQTPADAAAERATPDIFDTMKPAAAAGSPAAPPPPPIPLNVSDSGSRLTTLAQELAAIIRKPPEVLDGGAAQKWSSAIASLMRELRQAEEHERDTAREAGRLMPRSVATEMVRTLAQSVEDAMSGIQADVPLRVWEACQAAGISIDRDALTGLVGDAIQRAISAVREELANAARHVAESLERGAPSGRQFTLEAGGQSA